MKRGFALRNVLDALHMHGSFSMNFWKYQWVYLNFGRENCCAVCVLTFDSANCIMTDCMMTHQYEVICDWSMSGKEANETSKNVLPRTYFAQNCLSEYNSILHT